MAAQEMVDGRRRQARQQRRLRVAVALVLGVGLLAPVASASRPVTRHRIALGPSATTSQQPTREVYYVACGLEHRPSKCQLRTMSEALVGDQVVSTVPAWFDECGPSGNYSSATISADGTTAVTLEDISKAPGSFGDKPICRLVATDLSTSESHILPAYSATVLKSIEASGWCISPNGKYIAIDGKSGIYIQDVQAATPPKLLHINVGWGVVNVGSGVAWVGESRLIVDGPARPGRDGRTGDVNHLFEYTLSGHKLGAWLLKPYPAYQVSVPRIDVGPHGEVYAAIESLYDPTLGGKRTVPSGYYSLSLHGHVHLHLITRDSRKGYGVATMPFGLDTENNRIFVSDNEHSEQVCSVNIKSGKRNCINREASGVQVATSF
jgi:hypothetical protein